MKIRVDKRGRIIIPKSVRDRFDFRAGSVFELEACPGGMLLRPSNLRPSMVKVKSNWVHLGRVPHGFDWDRFIDSLRDERIKDISGL